MHYQLIVNGCVKFFSPLAAFMALAVSPAGAAQSDCRLCAGPAENSASATSSPQKQKPLNIEITANLDFSRIAMTDRTGGEISIDPISGQRRISGSLTDLGGMSLKGEGRLSGEPGRYVRVDLPHSIILSAPDGSTAELVKLETDLPAQVRLDQDGKLTFYFGGRLRVTGNAGGQYRGRIAITADYE